MITESTSGRPDLPTLYASYRAVEDYLELLEQAGVTTFEAVAPIDTLAIRYMTAMAPRGCMIVDLAAGPTAGTSTVICSVPSSTRGILHALSGSSPGSHWQLVANEFIQAQTGRHTVPTARFFDSNSPPVVSGPTLVIVPVRHISVASIWSDCSRWMFGDGRVAVVLLGLGKTGDCDYLRALWNACSGDSVYRIAMIREQAAAFHGSTVGVIYHNSDEQTRSSLSRVTHLFDGNFSFLNMARRVCEDALAAGREGSFPPVATLAEARRLLAAKDRDLAVVRGSRTFRAAERIAAMLDALAPRHSLRRRVVSWAFALPRTLRYLSRRLRSSPRTPAQP